MQATFARDHVSARHWFMALAALTCCISLGCSDDHGMVPVSGQATYGGGSWPMPGAVTFTPLSSAGGITKPGSARFQADGKFVVGSFGQDDGLVPGVYSVVVTCIDPLDFSKPREELDLVPSDYKPEDLIVEAGMDPIVLNFDVPKKKNAK